MKKNALTPTDAFQAIDPFDLDDIVAEINAISSSILIVSNLVEPKQLRDISTPSDNTLKEAFFAITKNLEHVADFLLDFENRLIKAQKETTTPTDESKDCR